MEKRILERLRGKGEMPSSIISYNLSYSPLLVLCITPSLLIAISYFGLVVISFSLFVFCYTL